MDPTVASEYIYVDKSCFINFGDYSAIGLAQSPPISPALGFPCYSLILHLGSSAKCKTKLFTCISVSLQNRLEVSIVKSIVVLGRLCLILSLDANWITKLANTVLYWLEGQARLQMSNFTVVHSSGNT